MRRRRTRSPRVWGRPKLVAFLKPCEADRQSQSGSASERSRPETPARVISSSLSLRVGGRLALRRFARACRAAICESSCDVLDYGVLGRRLLASW